MRLSSALACHGCSQLDVHCIGANMSITCADLVHQLLAGHACSLCLTRLRLLRPYAPHFFFATLVLRLVSIVRASWAGGWCRSWVNQQEGGAVLCRAQRSLSAYGRATASDHDHLACEQW